MTISAWTKHLKTEEEKEQFQRQLIGAKPVLNRLAALLKEKEADLDRSDKSLASYDNPNWSYRQAHKNGYSSSVSNTLNLIDLERE